MPDPEHVRSARDVYDHSAGRYANLVGTTVTSQFETAIDRAILDAFAEDVSSRGQGPVLDIGCGPGRVTGYLAERGLDISGVDISPRMIATARSAHPGLRFDVGSLTELPVADGSLLGAVLWYSIIHTPFAELRAAWVELTRVLAATGAVLVGFQAGQNDRVEVLDAYGSETTLTLHRHSVDDVAQSLNASGFDVRARIWREAELAHETTPQAFLLARRR